MLTLHTFQEVRMFPRIPLALGLTVLVTVITAASALAKGGFNYIAVTGANLKEEVRLTDPALNRDFFAFADFYRDKTEEPAEPGTGHEITRYYVDGTRAVAFDELHYYPETGYVYYDGIAGGGWSEYDDQWYLASPEIKSVFEEALSGPSKAADPIGQPLAAAMGKSSVSTPSLQVQPVTRIALILGLAALLVLSYWFRKPAAR
jgi:hypothetical protein